MNGGKEMLKKILLASIFVITATTNVTHAEDDMKTVASKAYVDTKIETKQLKIPAANTPGVGAGETVMTYTATGNGQIGERGLYSDISSYDATTDGDKLITASALNATFTNLPTTPTTKLECANQADGCTLWTIVDQTAYHKPRKNLFDKDTMGTKYVVNLYVDNELSIGGGNAGFIIPVMPNTQYTLSTSTDLTIFRIATYYKKITVADGLVTPNNYVKQTNNTPITFTTTDTDMFLYVQVNSNLFNDVLNTLQLELGSTATPYEPYY